mgnify:CR=1 FL=1
MSESNLEAAQRIQEKFQFYLVAVVFTILGLSIQTAKFGGSSLADVIELISWLFLLVSALTGMSYLEWSSVTHKIVYRKTDIQGSINRLREVAKEGHTQVYAKDTGKVYDIVDYYQNLESKKEVIEESLNDLEGSSQIKYKVMKYGFGLGLAFLVVARSIVPINCILTPEKCPSNKAVQLGHSSAALVSCLNSTKQAPLRNSG